MYACNLMVMSVGLLFMVFLVLSTGYVVDPGYLWYGRSDWDAAPATDVTPLQAPVPYVVIHHTYIPGACNTSSECKAAMRGMQNYHISLGWGDIGYNFCVGSEGGVYEGRGWSTIGIHTGRANNYSIGICLIGDWRVEVPPPIQLSATKFLISKGVSEGIISPDYRLISHKQVMATECPGNALQTVISSWDHFWQHPDFSKASMEKLKTNKKYLNS